MEALILDEKYETTAVLDTFASFIWTVRYNKYGEFEIYMPVDTPYFQYLLDGKYLMCRGSDRYMIMESFSIDVDSTENTRSLTITGRSLESILDRRIIWKSTILSGNLQNGIKKLLNENVISPSDSRRKIPGFVFKTSTDPAITSLTLEAQYFGENLYDVISSICEDKGIGFRVLPLGEGGFEFELYCGVDRSYAQDTLPWVVFSSEYENLLNSNYFRSETMVKTAVLVKGQNDIYVAATDSSGGGSGLKRKEIFTESSGGEPTITYDYVDEEGNTVHETIENPEYRNQLREFGEETLSEYTTEESFEGEIEAIRQFIYDRDFSIGDIVQIVNEYGMEAVARITEVVRSHDTNGEILTPTFTSL